MSGSIIRGNRLGDNMGNNPTHIMNATEHEVATTDTGDVVILTEKGMTYREAIESQSNFLEIHLTSGYQPTIYARNSGSEMLTMHHYETERNKRIIDFACRMATKHSKYDYSIDDSGNYPSVVRA